MSRNRRSVAGVISVALAAFLAAASSFGAQQQLGGIQGTISDATHAVLPGTTITVTNLDTGISRTEQFRHRRDLRPRDLNPRRYRRPARDSDRRQVHLLAS